MMPRGHTIVAAAVGGIVWGVTGSPWALPAAVGAGVLVDADHAVDYLELALTTRRRHFFVPLHGYELAVVAFLAAYLTGWNPVALGAAAGYLAHLLGDQLANPVPLPSYFLAWRIARRFRSFDPWEPAGHVSDPESEEERVFGKLLQLPGAGLVLFRLNPRLRQFARPRRAGKRA